MTWAPSSDGIPNVWDANTGYLSPEYNLTEVTIGGPGTNTYLSIIKPDTSFDSIVFTVHDYRDGIYDDITFSIGQITPVPEPSGVLLLSFAGMTTLLRRRRVTNG